MCQVFKVWKPQLPGALRALMCYYFLYNNKLCAQSTVCTVNCVHSQLHKHKLHNVASTTHLPSVSIIGLRCAIPVAYLNHMMR